MEKKELLIKRLEEIGISLKKSGNARALLGLGSAGKEIGRLDDYSDIDFFAIVKKGFKQQFVDNIDWLTNIAPADFYFKNTADGYKLLFNDGIYCEFAVFEEDEVSGIPFAEGKVVWQEEDFNASILIPKGKREPWKPGNLEWAVGEILTCIYVGLCRYARGEKLSGTRFVQSFAVDILLAASSYIDKEKECEYKDEFQNERRYEIRYPDIAKYLPEMIQGYDKVPQSAIAIVNILEKYVTVNQAIKNEIIRLAEKLMLQ